MANRTVLEYAPDIPQYGRPWGWEALIELYDCNPGAVGDPGIIRGFLSAVVPAIGMTAHGEPILELFGEGPLHGYSALQWIKTSSVLFHANPPLDDCTVNVYSCKEFDPCVAAATARDHFGGRVYLRFVTRGRSA